MKRREFIRFLGGAASAWPFPVCGQTRQKAYRVGLIITTSPVSDMEGPNPKEPLTRAFVHGMRDLGYIEGKNLMLERRSAEGKGPVRAGEIGQELIQSSSDVIVTTNDSFARELKRVTSTVPIVMTISVDPVGAGIVASIARPGGNITGLTLFSPSIGAKRLQILKEAVPTISRIAYLGRKNEWEAAGGKAIREAAHALDVTLFLAEHSTEYTNAFEAIVQDHSDALFVGLSGHNFANRQIIVDFATAHRLPAAYPSDDFVKIGGLMSYGASLPDMFRRAASYVDKILKGAIPADLPLEQPTKFELAVNLKTVNALGNALSATLLGRADEVIE